MIGVGVCETMGSLSNDGFGRSRRAAMDEDLNPSYGFKNPVSSSLDGSDGFYSNDGELVVDLHLGRLVDRRSSKEEAMRSPEVAKRRRTGVAAAVRTAISTCQVPRCQVQGCNLDLSCSKEYHKRHKVCDAHSKTAKVIVNGVEQRFCQQCSRFHLLVEFDEAKRSCRRRLAGHNERRRKPQLAIYSGKSGKLLPVYQGGRFSSCSTPSRISYSYQDIFSGGGLHDFRYGHSNWSVKLEEDFVPNGQSHLPALNGVSVLRSSFSPHMMEKQYPSVQYIDTTMGPICCESIFDYTQPLTASRTISRSQKASSGNDPFTGFSAVPSFPGSQKVPDSLRALSLLSSQSLTSSTQSSVMTIPPTFMIQEAHAQYNASQFLDKQSVGGSPIPSSLASSNFLYSGTNYGQDDHINTATVPDISDSINFQGVHTDDMFHGSDFVAPKEEHTIDLLQLSSQLQNAEHHRQVEQERQGNESFHWNNVA